MWITSIFIFINGVSLAVTLQPIDDITLALPRNVTNVMALQRIVRELRPSTTLVLASNSQFNEELDDLFSMINSMPTRLIQVNNK